IALEREFPIEVWPDYHKDDAPIRTLHVHDCLEIGYCHEGSGLWVIGEKLFNHQAGDVTFINHTEVHFAQSAAGTESVWTWILLDPVRLVPTAAMELMDPTPLAGVDFRNLFSEREHPALVAAVRRLIAEHREKGEHWREAVRALVSEIMILVRRTAAGKAEASPRSEYDRLAPALQMMARDYGEALHVDALARRCGLSEPHFRRLFVATMGRAPIDYLNNLRLHMAAALLRTSSRSVLEVSLAAGFGTMSSFNRLFRRKFERSPREWRKGGEAEAEGGA
ncbi:MAG: helix-turn-helix domain-containing protein, partial [Burkholderiales bacterium]|nr:helix-turn-helix domain-containing protein [Opitutaceae bacterium]